MLCSPQVHLIILDVWGVRLFFLIEHTISNFIKHVPSILIVICRPRFTGNSIRVIIRFCAPDNHFMRKTRLMRLTPLIDIATGFKRWQGGGRAMIVGSALNHLSLSRSRQLARLPEGNVDPEGTPLWKVHTCRSQQFMGLGRARQVFRQELLSFTVAP